MLTARDDTTDKIVGLELGADDYITKPFNNDEVIARINAVLRRATPATQSETLSFPEIDLEINFSTYEVVYKKRHMDMTGKMFEVLSLLARSAPKVVTYQEIAESVWGENNLAVRNL